MAEALTLRAIIERASVLTMEEFYESLQYDYSKASRFDDPGYAQERNLFLRSLAWKSEPTGEVVRRLFNQINSFYSERWMLEHLAEGPCRVLCELNRRLLFKQGKMVGARNRPIGYGYRVYLDFMDPFRRMKWLAGAPPEHISSLIDQWSRTAEACVRTKSSALMLSMLLIAIHPFVDANGRVARLVYTWFCNRWELPRDSWMAEGGDGELLRTGHGLSSTEYLMAQLMIALSSGANVIDPGSEHTLNSGQAFPHGAQMASSLLRYLQSIEVGGDNPTSCPTFTALLSHLDTEGHFRETSPRFESLRPVLY